MKDKARGKKNSSYLTTKEKVETAVLIAVEEKLGKNTRTTEFLDELEFLTLTAGATSVKRFVQKLATPEPRTYVGAGKLEEIVAYVAEHSVDLAVFDDANPCRVNVEHPTGALTVELEWENGTVVKTGLLRTARKLMDGKVYE